MRRIRMRTLSAGPSGVRQAGSEYDESDKVAKALVEAEAAEYVEAPAAPEREEPAEEATAADDGEQATTRRRRGGRT